MAETNNTLEKLFYEVNVTLGGTSLEVELEDDDYTTAFDEAVRVYRSMSANSVKEGWVFMDLEPGQQRYTLPSCVDTVKDIRRTRSGLIIGDQFEPFSVAFLQRVMEGGTQGWGGLATFDFLAQFQKTVGRLFGENVMYQYNEHNNELYIFMIPRSREKVGISVSIVKSVDELLKGGHSYHWLRKYTEAVLRQILGEKYSKFATMPGAQGGTVLKGDRLVQGGSEMKQALEQALLDFEDGGSIPQALIG